MPHTDPLNHGQKISKQLSCKNEYSTNLEAQIGFLAGIRHIPEARIFLQVVRSYWLSPIPMLSLGEALRRHSMSAY